MINISPSKRKIEGLKSFVEKEFYTGLLVPVKRRIKDKGARKLFYVFTFVISILRSHGTAGRERARRSICVEKFSSGLDTSAPPRHSMDLYTQAFNAAWEAQSFALDGQ